MRINQLFLILCISLIWAGCKKKGLETGIDFAVKDGMQINQIQYDGIMLDDEKAVLDGMKAGTPDGALVSDLFNVVCDDERDAFDTLSSNNKINVYVDMSAGLVQNIADSREHMSDVVQSYGTNATFYKVAGINGEDPYQAEACPDFGGKSSRALVYFTNEDNYDGNCSKLKAGLEPCVNNDSNISVFITDFLLDEGTGENLVQIPDPKYASPTGAFWTENPMPWATEMFSQWFEGDHVLEILSVTVSTVNGKYGCTGDLAHNKACEKEIYYMFFTPKQLFGKSDETTELIERLRNLPNTHYMQINPLAYYNQAVVAEGVGDVEFEYESIKGNPKSLISENYQLQYIPFDLPTMYKMYDEKSDDDLDVNSNPTIVNNFTYNRDINFPYETTLDAKFYEVTDIYFDLAALDFSKCNDTSNPVGPYNSHTYPHCFDSHSLDLCQLYYKHEKAYPTPYRKRWNGADFEDAKEKDLFTFNKEDLSISLDSKKGLLQLATLDLENGPYARLFTCEVLLEDPKFSGLTEDQKNALSWKFYGNYRNSKGKVKGSGLVINNALKVSIERALDQNKGNLRGRMVYTYLIALNGHK